MYKILHTFLILILIVKSSRTFVWSSNTGTLVSSRYVVATAEIFYEQGGHDSRDNDAMDPRNWKALPGARCIDSIKTVESNDDDWKDIARIEVHPLYEGYCVNNCADAAK